MVEICYDGANETPMAKSHTENRSALARIASHEITWIFLILVAALLFFFAPRVASISLTGERNGDERMLFVGDVMLARNVERLMRSEGPHYPFRGVRDLFAEYAAVVGNFEASIPEKHVPTPMMTFRFSVDQALTPVLRDVGFTDFSLANNHAYDHGVEGHAHTRAVLGELGIASGGNPNTTTPDELLFRTVDGVRVAIVPVNATYKMPSIDSLEDVFARARAESDMQVLYIHWGTEYELSANSAQRTFAHGAIDHGIDAVIGHHPHVVQNIEVYRGAPIFYSLGNFIFDQYWESNVREGLAISLSFDDTDVYYDLIPVTSSDTKSAPRPMNRTERTAFLDELAKRSQESLQESIRAGTITQMYDALGAL
jgi:poly-gamma-glutamate synthesis protein (capsule biosynthesis protein)